MKSLVGPRFRITIQPASTERTSSVPSKSAAPKCPRKPASMQKEHSGRAIAPPGNIVWSGVTAQRRTSGADDMSTKLQQGSTGRDLLQLSRIVDQHGIEAPRERDASGTRKVHQRYDAWRAAGCGIPIGPFAASWLKGDDETAANTAKSRVSRNMLSVFSMLQIRNRLRPKLTKERKKSSELVFLTSLRDARQRMAANCRRGQPLFRANKKTAGQLEHRPAVKFFVNVELVRATVAEFKPDLRLSACGHPEFENRGDVIRQRCCRCWQLASHGGVERKLPTQPNRQPRQMCLVLEQKSCCRSRSASQ